MIKNILTVALISTVFSSFSQEMIHACSKLKSYSNQLKTSPFTNEAQVAQQKKYDVTFYHLDLEMTNLSTALAGTVEIHAKATEQLDSALFELHNGFTISQILVNGVATTTYTQNGPLLSVPVNMNVNDAFVVSITYNGTPPTAATNPLGGSGMTNDTSPSWGNRVTWSLSEPFSAFEWFPCKQFVKDKADSSRVSIKVPDNLMAGSNGVLDSVSITPGFKTFHWMHRHPIAYYLISVAVASYEEYTIYANPVGATEPIMIQNFIYDNPGFLPYYQEDIDETADMLELFSELYGLYPFADEKYGHCLAPLSGGMEHQTMTTQGFFERGLTAHELAHQWWGNSVTCGSWADIWINEGFASYSEYLMLNGLYSYNTAQQNMMQVHNAVMQQPGGSVWVSDSLNESAIFNGRLVYQKGGAIIHTLRHIINDDEQFFDLLKDFQVVFADSNATGLEFKAFAEQFTGMDFTEFFDQWYFGEGYPTYSVEYNQTATNLFIEVSQTVSRPSVTPFFTTPLDLRVTRTGLSDTTIRVDITSASTLITLPTIANFSSIASIDPSNEIINKIGTITNNSSLSIKDISASEAQVLVFPNPTTGNLSIQFEGEARTIQVINQKGKVVLEQNVQAMENVQLENLPSGQYVIVLSGKNVDTVSRSIIKQ